MLVKGTVYLELLHLTLAIVRAEHENSACHNRGKKTEKSPPVAKERESKQVTEMNRTQIHSEARNPKF